MTPGGATKRPGLDALLKGVARRECRMVGLSAGRSLSDLIGLLGELRSHDIDPLPAPAGARHLDAIRQDVVRHVGRVLGVRAGDDPRSGAGETGSGKVIRQAPG